MYRTKRKIYSVKDARKGLVAAFFISVAIIWMFDLAHVGFIGGALAAFFIWHVRKETVAPFGLFVITVLTSSPLDIVPHKPRVATVLFAIFSAWWLWKMYWEGHKQVKGGKDPQIAIFRWFGRVADIVIIPADDTEEIREFWIPPLSEEHSEFITISLKTEKFSVHTHKTTKDRIGFQIHIKVEAEVSPTKKDLMRFFKIDQWEGIREGEGTDAGSLMESAVENAVNEAMSLVDIETVLGFQDRTGRSDEEADITTTRVSDGTILKGKLDFAKAIRKGVTLEEEDAGVISVISSEGIEGPAADWGVTINKVYLAKITPDAGAKSAIAKLELALYNRRAAKTETKTRIDQVQELVDASGGTFKFADAYHEEHVLRPAAENSGYIGPLLDKLLGK